MLNMLLLALLWLCQSSYNVCKGEGSDGLQGLAIKFQATKWYGPSYQPNWWSEHSIPVGLRRHDFSYDGADGPDTWPEVYKECGGQQQSPINVQTKDLKKRKTKEHLKWVNYSNVPRKMVLQNSLHSIHANGLWKNSSYIPYITNGPLEKRYYFSQLHFHWGRTDETGSEHTVNGKSFPAEMHVVHDRLIEDPTNLSEESNSDHLVVVAYMFEIVKNDNPALMPILNGIKEVRGDEKKKATIKPFPLNVLVENFHSDYVTYKGSLTTPPCTEGVIWIINSKPMGISDRQQTAFIKENLKHLLERNPTPDIKYAPFGLLKNNKGRLEVFFRAQRTHLQDFLNHTPRRKKLFIFILGTFWQNINQLTTWSAEFFVQWTLSLLPYCLYRDMLSWLESKTRVCEIILAGFLLILIVIYLDNCLGIYESLKPCKNTEIFQFGYRKYNGPSVWKEHFENASGSRQSPINILQCEAVRCQCGPLQWELYSLSPEYMVMYNDGYSITLEGNWSCEKPKLTGSPLNNEIYVFNRLYFHWGPTDSEGSEHTLDYERFPLELHMIFLKEGFSTPMDAHYNQCPNGIVIVAFLFEITPVDNPGFLNLITDNLHKVKTPKSGCCIEPFTLNDIYPEFEFNYYKYDGSITQPPCSEIVTYIIQSETIAVSKRQMSRFRKLLAFDGKPMLNNSRPVQKLNDRTVYYYTS